MLQREDGRSAAKEFNDPLYEYLSYIAEADVAVLIDKGRSYGNSWKRRGGCGAFFVLCRKWDRLEHFISKHREGVQDRAIPYDIFTHIALDRRQEGLIDDIRDLRRYLILVEAEMMARGVVAKPQQSSEAAHTEDRTGMENPFGFDPYQDVVEG